MAKIVLKDAYVSVNSVDLSDHVESVEVTYNADAGEATAMGDAAHNFLPALLNQGVSVTFRQDFAASKVDATLAPLVGAAAFAIEVRPTSGSVSTTNPKYSGNVILTDYAPIGGSVGDVLNAPVQFQPGDGTGIVRATA